MSPEAWTFFTIQSTALLALVGKGIDTHRKEKTIVDNTQLTIDNTKSVSNGAIPGLVRDVGFIKEMVTGLDHRVKILEGNES